MNEAGDGNRETPTARAEVQHAETLEGRVLCHRMFVAKDAVVGGDEQDRGLDAALQQARCDARSHTALGHSRLERLQHTGGNLRGVSPEPVVSLYLRV